MTRIPKGTFPFDSLWWDYELKDGGTVSVVNTFGKPVLEADWTDGELCGLRWAAEYEEGLHWKATFQRVLSEALDEQVGPRHHEAGSSHRTPRLGTCATSPARS
ncbi:hypothetical protein [Salininema proteolyticum]|uniref:Uncharacterized protein n=1 Tax=Salininema proteolyticum TaxID=1607685 RepID=A0ABV8TV60_9ACTN